MTYCPTEWVSSYTYQGIRDRLVAEAALFPGAAPAERVAAGAGPAGDPAVHVAAVVNLTAQTATIEHVNPLPGDPVPTSSAADTRLRLRVTTANGATEEHPVEFKPNLCRLPDEDETGLIDAVIHMDDSTTAVEVLIDANPVATFRPGAVPGTVENLQVTRPTAEPEDEAGITIVHSVLSWDDMSAKDGHHTYVVQASTDHGDTWRTLAVSATETTLPVDPTTFASAEQVRFRVLTTNGISYTEASTDDVAVTEL